MKINFRKRLVSISSIFGSAQGFAAIGVTNTTDVSENNPANEITQTNNPLANLQSVKYPELFLSRHFWF